MLRRLAAAGRKIPGDLSLTGCDGIDFAGYNYPTLTTIRQQSGDLRIAVDRILNCVGNLRNAKRPLQQWIEPTLQIGESTAPPR